MIETLPKKALEVIDAYENLELGGKKVQCPYFINVLGVRAGVKVYLGKGSPKEIAEEAELLAKKNRISLEKLSAAEIKEFLKKNNLGVDCSGLLANIFQAWEPRILKDIKITASKGNLLRLLIAKFRRVENISVESLTSPENSVKLERWKELRPGDMIRTRGGKHILLIKTIERREDGDLEKFVYVHSTGKYGVTSGVREGDVLVNSGERLEDQIWEEIDKETERNYTYEGLLDGEENGVYRLHFLNRKS